MRISPGLGLSAVVLLVLAAELFFTGDAFEYRRSLLAVEPWRLLTGHFVHLSLLHALLNCVALVLIGRLFSGRLRSREFFALLTIAPLLVSLAFWTAMPELHWYRGLSGSLHALFFAGCVVWIATVTRRGRWLPMAALAGGALKVLLEQPWDSSFPVHGWLGAAVVPQAHLIGGIVGLAAGSWIAVARRKHDAARLR